MIKNLIAPELRCFLFMRRYPFLRLKFLLLVAINLLVLCYPGVGITNGTKVAVLPFQMNTDEDIEYINRGIRDMLASRITYGADIRVVEQNLVRDALSTKLISGKLTKKRIQEIGSTLGADYVVFGSITKIGDNLSIDINVLNVLEGGITAPVFTQSFGLDEVIPKMNVLAQGIKDTISARFGSQLPKTTSSQPPKLDETFFEEESGVGEVVPERIEEVDLTASDDELEIPKPPSNEVPHGKKGEDESFGE